MSTGIESKNQRSIITDIMQLIRWQNLVIIVLAMYLVRLMLVEPLLIMSYEAPSISSINFFLMVFSTLLIAAGGYIFNDIEDIKIDAINERKNIIGSGAISKDYAYNLYLALSFIGICIGFYLTFMAGIRYIAYVNLVSSGLLYFYSATYKKQFLIGNIIISFLTALCLAIVYLTEPSAQAIDALKSLITGYVIFSFMISMAREIIKDMEDIIGDSASECKTLPVVAGIRFSKIVASLFIITVLLLIIIIQITSRQWESLLPFLYVSIAIEIPLVILIVSLIISNSKLDYRRCSTIAKLIMVTGILSLPVFFYTY